MYAICRDAAGVRSVRFRRGGGDRGTPEGVSLFCVGAGGLCLELSLDRSKEKRKYHYYYTFD